MKWRPIAWAGGGAATVLALVLVVTVDGEVKRPEGDEGEDRWVEVALLVDVSLPGVQAIEQAARRTYCGPPPWGAECIAREGFEVSFGERWGATSSTVTHRGAQWTMSPENAETFLGHASLTSRCSTEADAQCAVFGSRAEYRAEVARRGLVPYDPDPPPP